MNWKLKSLKIIIYIYNKIGKPIGSDLCITFLGILSMWMIMTMNDAL